jgi:hypothetical protein
MVQRIISEFVILIFISWLMSAAIVATYGEFLYVNKDMRDEYLIILPILIILRCMFVYCKK